MTSIRPPCTEYQGDGIVGCSGYKYPEECPFNGKYDPVAGECKCCYEDAVRSFAGDTEVR